MKPVQEMIAALAADRESGASQMAALALEIIRSAVRSSQAEGADHLAAEIQEVASAMAECRPAMAAIKNTVLRFQDKMNEISTRGLSVEMLKRNYEACLDELQQELIASKDRNILNVARAIKPGAIIVTCSYSSTLIEAIKKACAGGKRLQVRISPSRLGSIDYGERTSQNLLACGEACQVVDDAKTEEALEGADMVLLGADTVFSDGSVLNGYPSLELAQAAKVHEPPVPVYIAADSSKFTAGPAAKGTEPGFDLVPGYLIEGFITEDGVSKTAEMLKREGCNPTD